MQLQAFDEASRVRLMELLDAKSEHHNTMRCDEVQAFMMALLSGPDALNPNDWLPEVLGDESLFDAKERTEIERLVIGLAADLRIKLSKKMLPENLCAAPHFCTVKSDIHTANSIKKTRIDIIIIGLPSTTIFSLTIHLST